jgi:hypothetical protein
MSTSSKDIRININIKKEEKIQNTKTFQIKKYKKQISFQNDNHKFEIFKKLNEGCVLNFIRSSERKESSKTASSEIPKELKYDLSMINKYEEKLNSSLSFISEFDLEDDENEKDKTFSSIDNDDDVEQVDIYNKNKRKISFDKDDEENEKLEKDWKDIKELLLNNGLN